MNHADLRTMTFDRDPILTRLARQLRGMGRSVLYAFEMTGYARAAAELRRQGYNEYANQVLETMSETRKES